MAEVVKLVCKVVCGVVGAVLGVVVLLLLVAVVRALLMEDLDYQEEALDLGERDHLPDTYLQQLPDLMARALSIRTVSTSQGNYDTKEMLRFHEFLRESFPNVFNSSFIEVEVVNKYSLLFTVKVSHSDVAPYLLMAHMDVVPVYRDKWTVDPWGGEIIQDPTTGESYIYGRGAIDDKLPLMSIMAALQYLTITGFEPERPFYVAFGHDEEVHGMDGARHIGKLLESRGVSLAFILDEGMPIVKNVVLGLEDPVAMIGVTEKGYMMVDLEVEGEGGHSSIPPSNSAVTRLAKAIVALDENPQPSMLGSGPEVDMFTYIAAKASWPYRLVYSNLWLFRPILEHVMSKKRETNAVIRTTTSATIVKAGFKENVVPAFAHAVINHRVHSSQSIKEVLEHDRRVIADPSVKIKLTKSNEPHPVSPFGPDVEPWRLLTAAIHHHFPNAITAPSELIGNTDTRYFLKLSPYVYRLNPIILSLADTTMIHGHDERISVSAVKTATGFFHHLILLADIQAPPLKTRPGHSAGEF